jgi:hypothetical protein
MIQDSRDWTRFRDSDQVLFFLQSGSKYLKANDTYYLPHTHTRQSDRHIHNITHASIDIIILPQTQPKPSAGTSVTVNSRNQDIKRNV